MERMVAEISLSGALLSLELRVQRTLTHKIRS